MPSDQEDQMPSDRPVNSNASNNSGPDFTNSGRRNSNTSAPNSNTFGLTNGNSDDGKGDVGADDDQSPTIDAGEDPVQLMNSAAILRDIPMWQSRGARKSTLHSMASNGNESKGRGTRQQLGQPSTQLQKRAVRRAVTHRMKGGGQRKGGKRLRRAVYLSHPDVGVRPGSEQWLIRPC